MTKWMMALSLILGANALATEGKTETRKPASLGMAFIDRLSDLDKKLSSAKACVVETKYINSKYFEYIECDGEMLGEGSEATRPSLLISEMMKRKFRLVSTNIRPYSNNDSTTDLYFTK